MKENKIFLETKEVTKYFGTVKALDKVSIQIRRGEIQGLIGENGSGKSTISSIIYGIQQATSGQLILNGKEYSPKSSLDARNNSISMIVQEKDTIDMLSIAENIFLGEENLFSKSGFINIKKMNEEAKKALEKVGLGDLDVGASINTLNFETRKLVEIAKAMYYDPELIIVDETTTALSHEGREKIHNIMYQLKSEGKAVLFISHDLPELMETCDCLTVLRDGKLITTIEKSEFSEEQIKKSMVGRTIASNLYRSDYNTRLSDKVVMELKNVFTDNLKDISFELHEGEILGLGGLSGCGMHEIGKLMSGLEKKKSGSIKVYGEELKDVQHALKNKIGYISKDRDVETLILNESIQDNLTISAWNLLKRMRFLVLPKDEKIFSDDIINKLNIKCSSSKQLVRELSGGNKQKISFGKLMGNNSKILILDSPTRGVDIGVKTTMYELINNLKNQGYAILIISEELPELIGMSDKILILKDGSITKEFIRHEELKDTDVIDFMI